MPVVSLSNDKLNCAFDCPSVVINVCVNVPCPRILLKPSEHHRNTDRQRMPGKVKKKKRKKGSKRPPTALTGKPPVFLGTLWTLTIWESGRGESGQGECGPAWRGVVQVRVVQVRVVQVSVVQVRVVEVSVVQVSVVQVRVVQREEPTGRFWGGPVYGPGSDSVESYGDQPDDENRHSEVESAGSYRDQSDYENRYLEVDSVVSYDPYLDDYWGYADYREKGEYSNVSLRSDMESDCEEDTPMEVEENPHRAHPSHSDAKGSENDEPPAPKAPPRPRCPGASKLSRVASREASSSEEDTPPPKAKGPRAHTPMPKPRGGKKAAAQVPAPEPGNTAGALPNTHAPKPGLGGWGVLSCVRPREERILFEAECKGYCWFLPSPAITGAHKDELQSVVITANGWVTT
ncbi:hypothetical protein P4O66_001082 [Electrophorus voltai]|uniref:Uncharacterized protein n=1 Tax=Electrophorus voltai TaxID=2609070 RepID=A0AAD8ZAA8_9TELE|nr:hypothetical protein P4O66_001082 [Electrophorus voltai]